MRKFLDGEGKHSGTMREKMLFELVVLLGQSEQTNILS